MSDEYDGFALSNADCPCFGGVAVEPPDWYFGSLPPGTADDDDIQRMPGAVDDPAIVAAWREWWLPKKGGA